MFYFLNRKSSELILHVKLQIVKTQKFKKNIQFERGVLCKTMQEVSVNIIEDKPYKNIVFITVTLCGYLKSSSSTFSTSGLSLLFLIKIFPENIKASR